MTKPLKAIWEVFLWIKLWLIIGFYLLNCLFYGLIRDVFRVFLVNKLFGTDSC
ncbi:hypothetical protein SAMN05443543_10286 [Flavobacterium flevense]|nr:hypothetical protein SAMN05443543_10286 [Flavobacterium flevense]